MSGEQHLSKEPLSREILAEAAAWIAELHDSERNPNVEVRVHAWLKEDERHRQAFERMTHAWDTSGALQPRGQVTATVGRSPARRRGSVSWAAGLAAAAAVVAFAGWYFFRQDAIATGIGQQQSRLLRDGTRVLLNTNTRIVVRYDEHTRRVRLLKGEALFDVSQRPSWPFVVEVDGQEIQALGTSFIVRHDDSQDLSITLVEGKVSVTASSAAASSQAQVLSPGDRLSVSRDRSLALDRPDLNRITAWERGRIEFEDTRLEDAAVEMNRYSPRQISIADKELGKLAITGVFRAGDQEEFLQAVTATFRLQATRDGNTIYLSKG